MGNLVQDDVTILTTNNGLFVKIQSPLVRESSTHNATATSIQFEYDLGHGKTLKATASIQQVNDLGHFSEDLLTVNDLLTVHGLFCLSS